MRVVLVHVDDRGDLTGFLELSVRDYVDGCEGPTPYVEGWYVEPRARRAGVGRALIEAAEGWSRSHGYEALASDVEADNQVSLEAHSALGFEVAERLVILRKRL